MDLHALRFRLVDGPNSWGARRRAERAGWLAHSFPDLAERSVVDLGGRLGPWLRAPVRPRHLHLINTEPVTEPVPDWVRVDEADACDLPAHLALRRYDLVYSNSVLEHVGGHERRLRFAETVHSLADAHWVQTPYRYFPIEPHWIVPGMQFLPVPVRVALARRWPLGHTPVRERSDPVPAVLWTELVGQAEMRHYFPQSRILLERLAGLPKSLIAVRGAARYTRPAPVPRTRTA